MYRPCHAVVLILIGLASTTVSDAQDTAQLFLRGTGRIEKGDIDGGIADLDQVLVADPNSAAAYFARAYAWDKKGDGDKAIADFTQVIRLQPKMAEPRFNRGRMWEKKADYDKAFADYSEALRLDPNNFRFCNNLAWMQATCPIDKYRDGKLALENALNARKLYGGDHWRIAATIAAAYAENGDCGKAREWQEKAIKLVGDDKAATDKDRASMRSRLDVYQANKPYREPIAKSP